ncbi:hypothetical protein C2845_PM11G27830 [Panicum miliaceum]|uniref:Uncharacterized protein n=1 Tax=Panicum miliaceum TaxID=4540 RepID=A0A3L6RTZ9_PANMI|nr:hypothetical protein C2845_PM11G27830 [Panicum miliaceum]
MGPQSSAVVLLHLRRLDRFLKSQGLHSTANTLERDSLAYFDAAHLQKLVKGGQWDDAWRYVRPFSPLWDPPEGEGTRQQYTDFLHCLEHNSMLDYLACRGEEGGRAARSLFWSSNNDDFRNKFPEIAQRHDLYRSMASARARASVDWEAIKLTTFEKLQELLHLLPDCFRTRETQRTPRPLEITPLALRGSRRHQRKRVDRKPAHELALFLVKKRLPSGPETRHSNDVGVSSATPHEGKSAFYLSSSAANKGKKRLRSQDDYCNANDQLLYATECTKKPRTTGDVEEPAEISP